MVIHNFVRISEVLRIRAFLMQSGEDYESMPISSMPLYVQLAFLLAKVKQPQEGFTFSELALAFYGRPSDIKKMADLKPKVIPGEEMNADLRQWTPTYPQGNRMKALAWNLRRKLIRKGANPNYSLKVPMRDIGEDVEIMFPIKTIEQFEKTVGHLERKRKAIDVRIEDLRNLQKLPAAKRAANTTKVLNEWRYNSH